jgi:hypothetical protein
MKICFIDNYLFGLPSHKLDDIIDTKIMKEFDITQVDKIKEADILIACRVDCELIHSKKPIILCERYDSLSIGTVPTYYSYKNVISIFKDYLPRDLSTLLKPTVKKRYHFKILQDIYNTNIDEDCILPDIEHYLHKFRMVPWGLAQYTHLPINKHMKYCVESSGNFDKTIDIFCVCHQHESPLSNHRNNIKDIIKNMKNVNVYCEDNVNMITFHEKLASSKIVVAPWGLGKRIASDQKAILCDCVLVKPDSDDVLTFPDLYQEKYYVKCKPDLSDLEDICNMILNDYDTYLERTRAANKLLLSITAESFQRNFYKNIKEVYQSK